MVRTLLSALLVFYFNIVQAKHPHESEQAVFNRVAIQTDTIFIGRTLSVKTITDGLIYADGNTLSIGIMEVEVLKVYRGKIYSGDKLLVCTWHDSGEYFFSPSIGSESIYFGVKLDNKVIIPSTYGYIRGVPEIESRIYNAIKLKQHNIQDKSNLFITYFANSKVIRNACNEPIN